MKAPKRTVFLRRTKATAPPETETEPSTDNQGTTKFTRRGSSKFKSRKEAELEKKVSEKNEVETRQPSLNDGPRRIERPTRKFVRRGGANATTTTTVAPLSQSTTAGVTRRPFRIASRRRIPGSTTTTSTTTPTTTSTQPTTNLYDEEESLQDIGDTDVIEDPTLEEKASKDSSKVTRRPIKNLKDEAKDQNPSATNEEETKRQSKKYSSSIKQNQLNDLLKSKSQEDTTENKTTEDITAETALALAAHQLITAPLPSITDFNDDDVAPTRKTQTTVEYKYTSREYNEYTGSQTPTYETYQSTAVPISSLGNFDQTTVYKTDFDSTKVASTDFDVPKNQETSKYGTTPTAFPSDYSTYDSPKFSTTTYDARGTNFPNTASQDYIRTTDNAYTVSEYDSSKATPTSFIQTNFPGTGQYRDTGNTYANDYERVSNYIPKGTASTYPKTVQEYVPRLPSNSFQNSATREFSTDYNLPTITTSLSPPAPSQNRYFSRTPPSISDFENTARNVGFVPKSTESLGYSRDNFATVPSLSVENTGYTGVQRGASRFRDNTVVVENYSTARYTGAPQDASHTREYLLESPVTKSYDANYQYLSPATTPVTPATTRKIVRKKIQRKISTTLRPTTPIPSTTVKPRRASAKPFEKVTIEGKRKYRPVNNYDYYDDGDEKVATKYAEGTKVVMHENGNIECLDIGNFPHPSSCKKFISCARIENGSLLGWEYICPKGLSFDPVGGICNWSAGLGCNEKDV